MAIADLLISVILDEALTIQFKLLKQYDITARTDTFDMPTEMKLTRGLAYEEQAEIYAAKAKIFWKLAYKDLSKNLSFSEFEPKRLERLKQMQN